MHTLCRYASIAILFVSATAVAQDHASPSENRVEVSGRVLGGPEKSNCSAELRNLQTYTTVQRTTCDSNGDFQFVQVPRGAYNLIVRVGTNEYVQDINLQMPQEEVEVRTPGQQATDTETVSLAEMRVPDKAKDELHKAKGALSKGDLGKADEYAMKALRIAPQYARAMTIRAVIMMARSDFKSALQLTNQSAKIDPMLPMTQIVRASALNDLGKAKEAQVAAEQGLRLDGSWQGHYELARSLMSQGQNRQALIEIERATALAPAKFDDLMLLRVAALLGLREINAARDALAAFLKVRPGDPRALRIQAQLNGR